MKCHHGRNSVRHMNHNDYWMCRFCMATICLGCWIAHTQKHLQENANPKPLPCQCCGDIKEEAIR